MEVVDQVALLVGALLPLAIAVINQPQWHSGFKSVMAFVLCFVASLVLAWFRGEINHQDLVETFATVYGAAMVTYTALWKPTNVAPSIESATSPTP